MDGVGDDEVLPGHPDALEDQRPVRVRDDAAGHDVGHRDEVCRRAGARVGHSEADVAGLAQRGGDVLDDDRRAGAQRGRQLAGVRLVRADRDDHGARRATSVGVEQRRAGRRRAHDDVGCSQASSAAAGAERDDADRRPSERHPSGVAHEVGDVAERPVRRQGASVATCPRACGPAPMTATRSGVEPASSRRRTAATDTAGVRSVVSAVPSSTATGVSVPASKSR